MKQDIIGLLAIARYNLWKE